ncbi:hypothetical protein, partial [uncultured Hymenobacter sp.]|uniref:hypothetical protein n=1 Tax=uncultured Hymenobacter sp. TaxID=170016 RepID=UPI0035CAE8D4
MKDFSPEVQANYQLYEQLLLGGKLTEGRGFLVTNLKPSSVRWKVDRLPVEHLFDATQPGVLHTEISIHQETKFKFLLFGHALMSTPLVNYDSLGPTHRNDRNVPLVE